ncbi:MAG: TIGR03643 family protein [Bacteroidia bacterium]|nr:TIGR03643 family protein [Bacteroidia bacterium]
MKKNRIKDLSIEEIDRIVEMAWEDRTTFDSIKAQFGLSEGEVIKLMRREMKPSSWRMWRARVQGRKTKHAHQRGEDVDRFRCSRQRPINNNKISKR